MLVFNKFGLVNSKFILIGEPLYDFSREWSETKDILTRLVTWGEEKQFTAMIDFIIMEFLGTYIAIFGWPLLTTFRSVVLVYHVAAKVLIGGEEITIIGIIH